MPEILPYDRVAAVEYAHRWAHSRNPAYYDFDTLGGDCTNFASQCLYAGAGVMDFTPTFGWYYRSVQDRAPAWTGVKYLYRFLVRTAGGSGPFARLAALSELQPGDLVQLSFHAHEFTHCLVVEEADTDGKLEKILLAAHSQDAELRPLSTYPYQQVKCLSILGIRMV